MRIWECGFRIGRSVAALAVLALCAVPASAQEHADECLGHHWTQPVYISEIHFQMAVILAFFALAGAWKVVSSLRRSRRCA